MNTPLTMFVCVEDKPVQPVTNQHLHARYCGATLQAQPLICDTFNLWPSMSKDDIPSQ